MTSTEKKEPNPPLRKRDSEWPRTFDLGPDSPLFFTENKDRILRQLLISDIEALTGRPFVVYFSSPYVRSPIIDDDIGLVDEALYRYDDQEVDILIESWGGHTDAAEGVISLLNCKLKSFRAIVPMRAKSNGTLICLAAEELIMGPTSELGPVEPSVDGRPVSLLQTKAIEKIYPDLHYYGVQADKKTRILAEKTLKNGVMRGREDSDIKKTVELICSRERYNSHGSVIDAHEASKLGFNTKIVDYGHEFYETWRRINLLRQMYCYDSVARNVSKFFESTSVTHAIEGPMQTSDSNSNKG